MMTEVTYKVLWVDDDETIVASTLQDAEDYNLELVHFTNWQDAESELRKNFQEYSAVILDANCKINRDSIEEEVFITAILPSLLSIFSEKRQYLPWYLLSAGTMANFQSIVKGANYQHSIHESEWGKMLYLKDAIDGSEESSANLFDNIQRIAKDMATNVVLYRHSDVFTYLGENRLIDYQARVLMRRMLSALYYPEDNIKYEYAGNPIRKVIEYVFRSARKHGLLAEECFDKKGHIVLLDASRYMAGLNISYYEGRNTKGQTRWGEAGSGKDGSGGDFIFPSDIAMIVKNALNYSSADSHTEEDAPYYIEEENKELFFSYVMQICHLIKWFGKYVEEHHDIEKNKSMQRFIENPSKDKPSKSLENPVDSVKFSSLSPKDIIGKKYLITKDNNGVSVCGISKLSAALCSRTGIVTVLAIKDNLGEDKGQYPFIVTEIE